MDAEALYIGMITLIVTVSLNCCLRSLQVSNRNAAIYLLSH